MARRSGQSGYIERKGNFYWVRFWKDQPGQIERAHCCVKICPVTGPGSMTKPEREHRAREIIRESGADTAEHFRQTVTANLGTTFHQQADWWIQHVEHRKRRPVKLRTVTTWKSHLRWINPRIGDMPLSEVDNDTLHDLVAEMFEAGFKPKTILNYSLIVKLVVASAKDKKGKKLHLRDWDHEVIDMPIVEKADQNTPTFTAEEIQQIIARSEPDCAVLYALLACSGLRIGEALALEVTDFQDSTLSIRHSIWNGTTTSPKTRFSVREVDLPVEISQMLTAFIADRKDGFLFLSSNGQTAMGQRNLLRDSLHPILQSIGLELAGFHAFRRYRVTHLRKQKTPEDLLRYWIGHGDKTVTDRYQKLAEDITFRKAVAEQVGTGLPLQIFEVVPYCTHRVLLEAGRQVTVN